MNAYRVSIRYPRVEKVWLAIRSVLDAIDGRLMCADTQLRELDPRPTDGDVMRVIIKPIKWEGCL